MKLTATNVIACLKQYPQGLSSKEILKAMGLKKAKKTQLRGILKGLGAGRLIIKDKARYKLSGKPIKEKRGQRKERPEKNRPLPSLMINRGIFYWQDQLPHLWPYGTPEPFILSQKALSPDLIPGDEVTYEPKVKGGGHALKITGRKVEMLKAKIVIREEKLQAAPLIQGFDHPIALSNLSFDAHLEDKECLINTRDLPQKAKVLGVLPDNPSFEEQYISILAEFNLKPPFPPKVLKFAESFPEQVEMIEGREDLRSIPLVTIDGADAKDYDDAIYAEATKEGYILTVAIADVAHYVQPGSPIDQEAERRSTSVYLPGWVMPMLPESLSNGLCSLKEGVNRLALVCRITLDQMGNAIDSQVFEAVIKVRQRLTYDQVDEFFETGEQKQIQEGLLKQLTLYRKIASILQNMRSKRGAISFSLPDNRFIYDQQGQITNVVKSYQSKAQKLIEEFMLEANEAIGHLVDKNELSILWRNHPNPLPEKIKALKDMLHNEGIRVSQLQSGKDYNQVLAKAKDAKNRDYIEYQLLRSMSLALYESERLHHFGLGASHYLHFTSPIRRYPDLVVHRAVKSWLGQQKKWKVPYWLGAHTSERERNAQKAERKAIALQKMILMAEFVGQVFTAKISGLHNAGIWVELHEPYVEGFIPYSGLLDDHYRYDENQIKAHARKSGRVLQFGTPLTVILTGLDQRNRSLNFTWLNWLDSKK